MLTVGDKIPNFILPVQQGTSALPNGETIDTTPTSGRWKILFYWPKDFTFVCPTDTAHVHFAWRKSDEQLPQADFPWIADNNKMLANALGIVHPEEGVAYRATFIIDPDNVIQHVTVNGLNVGRNAAETLRILNAPSRFRPGRRFFFQEHPCRLKNLPKRSLTMRRTFASTCRRSCPTS